MGFALELELVKRIAALRTASPVRSLSAKSQSSISKATPTRTLKFLMLD
jgi:hypothetical protein